MISIATIDDILPPELRDKYRGDQVYSSIMVPVANRFYDWFNSSDTPFFRFYTDHSGKHCLDVFRTGLELIAPEAYQRFSIQDLSILLAASFCHDAGMHLTEQQFHQLVDIGNTKIFSELDALSWPELWENFVEDAMQFNQRSLLAIFGDARPIEIPPSDISDFTDRHRLLIGEFLRRHHPRLGHDLALGLYNELGLNPPTR